MTDLSTTPNVEAAVIAALLADDRVAAVVGTRVTGRRPANPVDPSLVVHRAGGPQTADWLDQARIQVDAWGTSQGAAWAAARAACDALFRYRGASEHGIITGVARSIGPQPLDDPVTGRPRYITEFVVDAHPVPA